MAASTNGGNALKERIAMRSQRTAGSGNRPERLEGSATGTVSWPIVILAIPVILAGILIAVGAFIAGR